MKVCMLYIESMEKLIKKKVDFEIDFKCDLNGFWERKWKQVGTQKRSTIEAATKAEKSIEH